MTNPRALRVAAFSLGLLASTAGFADITFFVEANVYDAVDATRDQGWQTAVPDGFSEHDLADFPNGTTIDALAFDTITVDLGLDNPAADTVDVFAGNYAAGGGNYGTVFDSALLNVSGGAGIAQDMTFNFSSPVAGFGAWIFDDLGPNSPETSFTLIVTEVGGAVYTSGALDGGNAGGFFVEGFIGAVSDVGIESAVIRTSNSNDFFEVDHLQLARLPDTDTDSDGISDPQDNCTEIANPDQRDTDGDGYGNICDPDLDNDGTVNFVDLNAMAAVFFSPDADADLDGSGLVNFTDLNIMAEFFFGAPGPSGLAP